MRVLGIDPGKTVGLALLDVGASQARFLDASALDAALLDGPLMFATFAPAPDLVAIEKVEHVHGSDRMGSSYAEGLARAAWVGGELAAAARAAGLRVITVEASAWRRAIVGSRTASDATIAKAIRLRVPTWPSKSNAHQRDAAGVALWAGLAPR